MSGRYWDAMDKSRHRRDAYHRDDDRSYRRRSRSRERDRHRRRYTRSISRSRSQSRSKSRSRYEHRDRRHRHKSNRSPSNYKDKQEDRSKNDSQSKTIAKSSSLVPSSHNNDKSTESTLDGFDFGKQQENNTQYIGKVASEEERKKIHEQMQERLRKLKESEPKRLQPTKPASLVNATPFANDGSFLEKFKEMQERFAQQQETQQREKERLRLLPMVGRRRGGKILKTGIVEKPKRIEDYPADGPKDAWSLYLQEVKRYKNATCDPDAPSRSLVK